MRKWIRVVAVMAALCVLAGCSKPSGLSPTTTYEVVITGVVGDGKIKAIKGVRELTGLGLDAAKNLVESAPCVVKVALSREEAEQIAATLKASSLKVEIKEQ